MQYRQGDVFLQKIEKLPDGKQEKVPAENGKLVLAHGEATGHHHAVDAHKAVLMLIGTAMYLRCLKQTVLRHEEHGPVVLPAGDYLVRRQREYSPEEIRNVAD